MSASRKVFLVVHSRIRRLAKRIYHRKLQGSDSHQAVLLVLGCQRSGTTALLGALEQDWNARVFGEFSELNVEPESRAKPPNFPTKSTLRLRPLHEVSGLIRRAQYPLVVCKPLVESHRANELLQQIENARCLWVFRHYHDVADSIVRKWPDSIHVDNLEPIVRAETGNWRSESVPDDVRALITKHYSPTMNPYDGAALIWYARNRLYFEQNLVDNSRVKLLRYEDFVADPVSAFERIYRFAGAPYPGPKIARSIRGVTVGRGRGIRIHHEVETCCEELWGKLLDAYDADVPDREDPPQFPSSL